jgi:diguanylate cyclase (GGDEF)-like protein
MAQREIAAATCAAGGFGIFRSVPPRASRQRLTLAVLLAALSWAIPAVAQTTLPREPGQALTQYKIDGWQTEQGLPLNTVQATLQTRDGHLWVGTGGGLVRFDGIGFTTFETSAVPELASRSIFGFMEGRGGELWIGHAEGASVYRNGHFEPVFGREVTDGRRVWSFAEAEDGTVWVATESGLVRWKGEVQKIYRTTDGLPTDRLRSVAIDRDGTLWIASTGGGLVSFNGARFEVLTPAEGFPHRAVRSVIADPAGGVWAATAGGGLAHVERGVIRTFTVEDGLPTNQLTALAADADGSLWIGTWGSGLSRLREGRFSTISTEGGLAGGQIWSVYADREGSVWVGTWVGGLNRLRIRDFAVLGAPEGLSHDNVRSVIHARDGSVWVSTSGGGVNRIRGAEITSFTKRDGLPTDEASSLLEDRDGAIWIGTYTGGIARLDKGGIESFGTSSGLPSLDVRSLYQDRSGRVWAGTVAGVAQFDGSGFVPLRKEGAPLEGVNAILEDREGSLWFGTGEGLVRYREGIFTTFTRDDGLVSNWILSLYEDAAGSLWIGTNGEGLNRLSDGRLAAIRRADGLWDGIVQVILEDRRGNFWITCNRGFFRVARSELDAFADGRIPRVTSVGYGPGDALRSTSFAGGLQHAGAVDAEGHLWLPSFSGLVIVDPEVLPDSGAPPFVRLVQVIVDGVEVPPGVPIVLPPGSVPLSIRYTTTTLRNAERVRFRYRMEGTAGGWVDAGRRREAFFPALPHGEYRFRLAASTDGVSWREAAAPLQITVRPHFFQTRWFMALILMTVVALTAAVLRLRTRHLLRQKAEMERLVEEKTEELRLANEHLAWLSFVDALTGLPNRRRFDEALEQEWKRARRFQTSLAVLVIDVDLFKAFNDALGHPEGDRCLAEVSAVLMRETRRSGDLVARYGGEEFVVLIPGADQASAAEFAERLRRACETRAIPHPASLVSRVVTISIGVAACVPTYQGSSGALMQAADAGLYEAKRRGRNRVASATPPAADAAWA